MEKNILVKIGGEVAENLTVAETLLQDLIELKKQGFRVVLCHGGGPQISRELKIKGLEPRFVNGQRVTDDDTLKITCKVLIEQINAALVKLANSQGQHAVGLSGMDKELYQSVIKDPELGYVGNIEKINTEIIEESFSKNLIPVVACIGQGKDGQIYNINADSAAGELAKAIKAEQFLLFTNVSGLYRDFSDKSSLIKETNLSELKELLKSGSVAEGMIPKLESVISALSGGVKYSVIVDGRKEHAVLNTVNAVLSGLAVEGTVIKS